MPKSMSSTTLVNVYSGAPSALISTGSESEPTSTVWSPRMRSFHDTMVGSGVSPLSAPVLASLNRQCGRRPSDSSFARSSGESFKPARS